MMTAAAVAVAIYQDKLSGNNKPKYNLTHLCKNRMKGMKTEIGFNIKSCLTIKIVRLLY
jgi:hypothetical protein